jgi:hypothetical protein
VIEVENAAVVVPATIVVTRSALLNAEIASVISPSNCKPTKLL